MYHNNNPGDALDYHCVVGITPRLGVGAICNAHPYNLFLSPLGLPNFFGLNSHTPFCVCVYTVSLYRPAPNKNNNGTRQLSVSNAVFQLVIVLFCEKEKKKINTTGTDYTSSRFTGRRTARRFLCCVITKSYIQRLKNPEVVLIDGQFSVVVFFQRPADNFSTFVFFFFVLFLFSADELSLCASIRQHFLINHRYNGESMRPTELSTISSMPRLLLFCFNFGDSESSAGIQKSPKKNPNK